MRHGSSVGDIEAGAAQLDPLLHLHDAPAQLAHVFGLRVEEEEGEARRGLPSDAGQPRQVLYESLDGFRIIHLTTYRREAACRP